MNRSNLALKGLIHFLLIAFGLVWAAPLLWMFLTAVKPIEETMGSDKILPSQWLFDNFYKAVVYGQDQTGFPPFIVYAVNTVCIAVLSVCGAVLSNALVAYSFAKLRWKGRDLFFAITLATIMIPFPVLLAPTFGLFKSLGWVGTFRPLWVPYFFANAFSIFLLRQFYLTIPDELLEAAKIDGATEIQSFAEVIVPLSRPAITVVALFTLMGAWNDFLGPMVYLVDQKTFTLSVGLQAYQTQHGGTPWNLLMAATLLVILPILVVFFIAQKAFIQGISTTGLK